MNTTHHELSPSSFPAWAVCPAFDSDPAERADAAEGTRQHQALAAALAGHTATAVELSNEAVETVAWAVDYIRTLAQGQPVETERRVSYTAPDAFAPGGFSEVYHGTADAIVRHTPGNLADLIDFKSGAEGDHRAQLAGYALALFSERRRLKTIRLHVLYGRTRTVDSWALSQADAAGIVLPILDARRDPARRIPAACDYCVFCAHRTTCPALTAQVEAVARSAPVWEELAPAIREPGAITDPAIVAKALTLARFVSTWADAIRSRATELAKGGAALPGYRLQERRTREVSDLNAAYARTFSRTQMTPGQFLAACKLSLPRLGDLYAAALSIPKAAATRELEAALGELIQEGTPTLSLVADRKGGA